MNGALYISFFQGQLESALEQVVQLAVQEITKTVGASLNNMLMETAVKEQENQRLKCKLQPRGSECKGIGNATSANGGREDKAASDGTKRRPHTPSQSSERGVQADTPRLEQKGRVVGQLKVVMEHVLEFAMCELTKIVEDSFDDLFLELTKKEQENELLVDQLQSRNLAEDSRATTKRKAPENDVALPSGSDDARKVAPGKGHSDTSNEADKQAVISVTQDWVPILDKVFGQKWCSDLWQIKEMNTGKTEESAWPAGSAVASLDSLIGPNHEPSTQSADEDPRWTPLEDMEVLSSTSDSQGATVVSTTGEESQLRSPSMLHRLLTLPSQILEDDDTNDNTMETPPLPPEASVPVPESTLSPESPSQSQPSPPKREDEEKEMADLPEGSKPAGTTPSTGRKAHSCERCGKKFSRAHLLRAHQQSHSEDAPLGCPQCEKRFSQASRLQAHLRMHVGKKT